MAQTPEQEYQEKQLEIEFGTAMCALTVLRYLVDYCCQLPLGLLGRLVSSNDTILALVALTDRPPWQRQRPGKLEKWIDNK